METIEQTINGSQTALGNGTVTISRNGDLVTKVYVTAALTNTGEDGAALINNVEVEIGGQRIDKQTSEWNRIWADLSTPESKADGFKCMTGGVSSDQGAVVSEVQVPLNFWFCRNPGLALPLIALQYHEVKLKCAWGATAGNRKVLCDYIYLDTDERRRFAQVSHEYLIEQIQSQSADDTGSFKLNFNHPVKELIWTSGTTVSAAYVTAQLKLNGHDRFSAQQEEYFQLRQPFDYHTAVPGQNIVLSSPSPVQTVVSFVGSANTDKVTSATDADNGTASSIIESQEALNNFKTGDVLLYQRAGTDATTATGNAQVVKVVPGTLTGNEKLHIQPQQTAITDGSTTEFSLTKISGVQDALSRTGSLTSKINVYSFALKSEEHQPSGTCNFSRIDTAKLDIGNAGGMDSTDTIYAVNYNVLRIMSGMGGLAYSN